MKYTFKPGIASALHIESEVFPERYGKRDVLFIYLDEGKKPESSEIRFDALPLKVRAEINKHFGTVFSMGIDARCVYMKDVQPWTVEVDDE